MNILLRDMPLFVEVAKHKSFTLAAEALDMYISTLSRKIAQLEKELGVQLFLRSTRHVELTESGRMLYERCRYLLAETETLYDEVIQNMTRPAGPVRVAVSPDVYHTYLWGIAGDFAKQWPDIHLHLTFMQRWVDLLTEPYDLDIRVGPLPNSDLKARKLIAMQPALYASPALLAKHPAPEKPADLKNFPCIGFTQRDSMWQMKKGKKTETVAIQALHTVNSISLCLELVQAGIGASWLVPPVLKHPALTSHEFVIILPGWTIPGIDLYVVMASNQLPHRVRLFLDHLIAHCDRISQ